MLNNSFESKSGIVSLLPANLTMTIQEVPELSK